MVGFLNELVMRLSSFSFDRKVIMEKICGILTTEVAPIFQLTNMQK